MVAPAAQPSVCLHRTITTIGNATICSFSAAAARQGNNTKYRYNIRIICGGKGRTAGLLQALYDALLYMPLVASYCCSEHSAPVCCSRRPLLPPSRMKGKDTVRLQVRMAAAVMRSQDRKWCRKGNGTDTPSCVCVWGGDAEHASLRRECLGLTEPYLWLTALQWMEATLREPDWPYCIV